jgi:hypothetical protein
MPGRQTRPGERTRVNFRRRDIYGVLADWPCSEMPSRPPLLLDPRQGDVDHNRAAPVKDALRSVPREFDTCPVSMNLYHPAAVNGPQKSGASAARAIATAAEQGPSIPA